MSREMKQRTATAKKPAVFATYGPTASRALPETSFGSTDYSALKRHSSTAHSRLLQSFDQVKIAESSDIAVHVCLGVCSHHDAANGVDSSRIRRIEVLPGSSLSASHIDLDQSPESRRSERQTNCVHLPTRPWAPRRFARRGPVAARRR